ncbi:HAD hydrolase family protein [Salipaludibacillus sp. LMS25]|jgi:hydroxymethylpyrimidine pyrophosphatase-like HAD family hydrolase|uniref:HAD family hydrolase n=1 Tax=Salipaludibacillus sp. LMS25 TaxID=2924031 RepID=UPI0020D13A97|nr:HAD hydrolase family protein [Salipaludibacillus sp. LMS25]UTR15257.1 HAD hydrolase family protein [Salipaludibacillus sp. LMS25]
MSFLGSFVQIERIRQEFEDTFTVISSTVPAFGRNSGELSVPGIHKAAAIENVIKHLKIKKENTFAYGDGLNDLEMIEFVHYSIAMGNAIDTLKKAANDVTDTPDNVGIYNSFKKYGLS